MREEITYCDLCAGPVYRTGGHSIDPRHVPGSLQPHHSFTHVPFDAASANTGESAVVCDIGIADRVEGEVDMAQRIEQDRAHRLANALGVFVLDMRIRSWLKENDPKALEQAVEALQKAAPSDWVAHTSLARIMNSEPEAGE